MTSKAATAVIQLALLAVACVGSFTIGRNAAKTAVKVQTDTLVVYDTIERIQPVFVRSTVVDTMFVAVCDTVQLHDTTFVRLPREERAYQDSTYYAVVSGFRPSLDTIRVFAPVTYITRTERVNAPNFGFGVAGGASLVYCLDGQIRVGLGASVGIYYRF